MAFSRKCSKYLPSSAAIINMNPIQHTHKPYKFSRCQVWMTGSSSCDIRLMPTRNMLMIKWRNLGIHYPIYVTRSLKMLNICSIIFKFPPRTMMLKMMDFRKSPSQHPKPSLPSLTHQFLKPNTDNKGGPFPPTFVSPLADFHIRRSWCRCWRWWTFGNHQVKIRNQAFQVRNITTSKPDTDDQGIQFTPTHNRTLEDCCGSRSWSWPVNRSHLAQTTYSQKFSYYFEKVDEEHTSQISTISTIRT